MSVTLDHLLLPFGPYWQDSSVEEITIQAPNVVWIYSRGQFTRHEIELDADAIMDIAIVAAAQRRQDVGIGCASLLSTGIDGYGRIQAVLPPCVADCTSLTIRRGSEEWPTLAGLAAGGLFRNTQTKRRTKGKAYDALLELYHAGRWEEFFRAAVLAKKTIIGCGVTASGKTHFSKAMIAEIPLWERLILIEDSPELRGIPHPNHVAMYYDKNAASGGVGATDLVEAAMRMRPERLFIQEIRDPQAAIAFLVALQTGHSGMTTIHASHCEAAFTRLRVLIKEASPAVSDADITSELNSLVDIVVHSTREDGPFEADQVWYRDALA